MNIHWTRTGVLQGAALLLVLLCASTAVAQDRADVAVFVTEVVEAQVGDEGEQVHFWWSDAASPQWTSTDEVVFAALRQSGVEPAMPERVDISRIYRRPGLSTDNAAQLGRLLDTDRVLVGEVQYRAIEPVAPLRYRGIEARAVVELVPAGDSGGISLERFTVTRTVFGADGEQLLRDARLAAGSALGEIMGQSMKRRGGQIGTRRDGALLALRNVERAENLEEIRRRLLDIEEVDRVVERWASEGLIALEVIAGGDEESVEYAYRVLENHQFEQFELMRYERPSAEGITEFWLEPKREGF